MPPLLPVASALAQLAGCGGLFWPRPRPHRPRPTMPAGRSRRPRRRAGTRPAQTWRRSRGGDHRVALSSLSNAKPGRRRPADRRPTRGQRARCARREPRHSPRGGVGQAEGGTGPAAPRRACLRGTARDGGSKARIVIAVDAGERPRPASSCCASMWATSSRDGSATAHRAACARRDESSTSSGPACRARPGRPAPRPSSLRDARDPELREPGHVRKLPGERIDAGALRHAQGIVEVEGPGQGARAAVAQRRSERGPARRGARHGATLRSGA